MSAGLLFLPATACSTWKLQLAINWLLRMCLIPNHSILFSWKTPNRAIEKFINCFVDLCDSDRRHSQHRLLKRGKTTNWCRPNGQLSISGCPLVLSVRLFRKTDPSMIPLSAVYDEDYVAGSKKQQHQKRLPILQIPNIWQYILGQM